MVIRKEALEKIRKIIEKHHKYLLITMIGQKNVPAELLAEMRREGLDPSQAGSLMDLAYNQSFINTLGGADAPVSVKEMQAQQKTGVVPTGEANEGSKEFLNSNLTHLIEKQRADTMSRIESLIQTQNNEYRFGALQEINRHESIDQLLKEKAKSKIKQLLRDASGDATRNWERVVTTELSNAISLGSADRIVAMNRDTPAKDILVYRIVVNDAALCKYCRKFYLDDDGCPKLYRMATILGNGTNYGKKPIDWKPVATATHPNERCSPLLELKRGWRVLPNGSQAFIGNEAWDAYIAEKGVD